MKNLFYILLIVSFTSCATTTARVSYKELPNKYKDIKISDEIIVKGDMVYLKTIKGTPAIVDTKIYDIEITRK